MECFISLVAFDSCNRGFGLDTDKLANRLG